MAFTKEKIKELEGLETERTKLCLKCGEIKLLIDFNLQTEGRKFTQTYCRNCERVEKYQYSYNMTIREYTKLLKQQDYKCAICGTVKPGGVHKTVFLVDHDHRTGKMRGLLCHNCNTGLGHFKDNPEFLASAIAYVLKHKG